MPRLGGFRSCSRWALTCSAPLALTGCPQLLGDEFDTVVSTRSASPSRGGGGGDTSTSSGGAAVSIVGPTGGDDSVGSTSSMGGAGGDSSGGQPSLGGEGGAGAGGVAGSAASAPGGGGGVDAAAGTGGVGGSGGFGGMGGEPGASGSGPDTSRALLGCGDVVEIDDEGIVDFESFDGSEDPDGHRFVFGGTGQSMLGELDAHEDGTGDYTLTIETDADQGQYARGSNDAASSWGGGVALLLDCIDASEFDGLSFRVRGSTPSGVMVVGLLLGSGDEVGYEFDMPAQWETIEIDFDDFGADDGSGGGGWQWGGGSVWTTGGTEAEDIVSITFNSQLVYQQMGLNNWVPQEGSFVMSVDDVAFY